jgi:CheY-like chemotaxis protein
VYGFIAQSGGDVLIESEPGNGAVLSIYLPVARDQSGDTDSLTGPALDTVLVVEDEPDLLDATAELLRSLGYNMLTASNGTEAMDALSRRDDIHILFTGVVLPKGVDGIQLARSTRNLRPDVRIVLASAYPLPAPGSTTAVSPTSLSFTSRTGWPISSERSAWQRSRLLAMAASPARTSRLLRAVPRWVLTLLAGICFWPIAAVHAFVCDVNHQ